MIGAEKDLFYEDSQKSCHEVQGRIWIKPFRLQMTGKKKSERSCDRALTETYISGNKKCCSCETTFEIGFLAVKKL